MNLQKEKCKNLNPSLKEGFFIWEGIY